MSFGSILLRILYQLLYLYTFVILAAALVSWLFLPPTNPVIRFLKFMTEPVLNPCRRFLYRVLPYTWRRIDFSPVLALVLIQLILYILERIIPFV
jgi:YggT family protein